MSTDKNTYIGAYIIIDIKLEKQSYQKYCCSNHKEDCYYEEDDEKFCKICGTPLSMQTIIQHELPDVIELLPEYCDELFINPFTEYTCFGNIKKSQMILIPTIINLSIGDSSFKTITTQIINDTVQEFKAKYKVIIKHLKIVTKKLEIKFGIINYIT